MQGHHNYYAVRVGLADGVSKSLLSSNSVPIGYNANNFSVTVQNAATVPNLKTDQHGRTSSV
jgi:hypothetical protein